MIFEFCNVSHTTDNSNIFAFYFIYSYHCHGDLPGEGEKVRGPYDALVDAPVLVHERVRDLRADARLHRQLAVQTTFPVEENFQIGQDWSSFVIQTSLTKELVCSMFIGTPVITNIFHFLASSL